MNKRHRLARERPRPAYESRGTRSHCRLVLSKASSPSVVARKRRSRECVRTGGRWQTESAWTGDAKEHDHGPPRQGNVDTSADRLAPYRPLSRPLVPRAPTGRAKQTGKRGGWRSTSGTCKAMYLDCPKSYLGGGSKGTRPGQKRNTRVCGTYCISFWGCALELLKYVMSGTGPTCHCCMICDKTSGVSYAANAQGQYRPRRARSRVSDTGSVAGYRPRNPGRD